MQRRFSKEKCTQLHICALTLNQTEGRVFYSPFQQKQQELTKYHSKVTQAGLILFIVRRKRTHTIFAKNRAWSSGIAVCPLTSKKIAKKLIASISLNKLTYLINLIIIMTCSVSGQNETNPTL